MVILPQRQRYFPRNLPHELPLHASLPLDHVDGRADFLAELGLDPVL